MLRTTESSIDLASRQRKPAGTSCAVDTETARRRLVGSLLQLPSRARPCTAKADSRRVNSTATAVAADKNSRAGSPQPLLEST